MKNYAAIFVGLLFSFHSYANITLPSLVGDHMVLQRDKPLKIWGWADKGEKITITFLGQKYTATTSHSGRWIVAIAAQKAGGPHTMIIEGKNTVMLTDILMGDVWICGGQSNMEVKMTNVINPDKEITSAHNPNIRLFDVAHANTALPAENVKGKWLECNPLNSKNFSAVAYFFARDIQSKMKVPVGLIECAYGGTGVEAWISPEALSRDPAFGEQAAQLKFLNLDSAIKNNESIYYNWVQTIDRSDPAYTNGRYDWAKQPHPEWAETYFPGTFEGAPLYLETKDGIIWVSKTINLTDADIAANCSLSLGTIDDDGLAFVNGIMVGSTRNEKNSTVYEVDKAIIHPGANHITVRIMDFADAGGMYGRAGSTLSFKTPAKSISLNGQWNYQISLDTAFATMYRKRFNPEHIPAVLFNGMIAPLTSYAFKGFLWYQGESNSYKSFQYRSLFKKLIIDWRRQFKAPDAPFIFVQLANYKSPSPVPVESSWAELREAQAMALSLKNTAMVNAIDIGEANDIHPKNKQDVGRRLALLAIKIAYGEKKLLAAGPMFKKINFNSSACTIYFDNEGSGLAAKNGNNEINEFAVATGENNQFVKVKATISGKNTITISSPDGKSITAVRYAWASNPSQVNLVNSEGLPTYPFRTDNFKAITYDKRYEGR